MSQVAASEISGVGCCGDTPQGVSREHNPFLRIYRTDCFLFECGSVMPERTTEKSLGAKDKDRHPVFADVSVRCPVSGHFQKRTVTPIV